MQDVTEELARTTLADRPGSTQDEGASLPRLGPVAPPEMLTQLSHRRRRASSVSSHEDGERESDDYDDAYGVSGSGHRHRSQPGGHPHFFPPLWLARRTACVQQLRAENVRTVADLGCGKGAVLSILVQPAWHKDDFPELYPPAPDEVADEGTTGSETGATLGENKEQQQSRSEKLAVLRRVPRLKPEENELHLSRVIGVDLDRKECEEATRTVKPPSAEDSFATLDRWEDLRVELYEGGVEIVNEALQGVDAIILTEVVEHLSEAALAKLPYILFSLYAPRLVIITTPNHAFNPYFPPPPSRSASNGDGKTTTSPASRDEDGHLFPDPTGRTRRVFRDATHTLEWTPEEFRAWSDQLLKTHASDYQVSIGGVGSLAAYWAPAAAAGNGIPFPPPSLALHPELVEHPACTSLPSEPDQFFATQVAVFKRQYSGEPERSPRSARPTPLPFFSPSSAPTSLPTSPGASISSLPPASPNTAATSLPPPKPEHELVSATIHEAHVSTLDPQPASLATLRDVIEAVFLSAGRGDQLSLADLWRIGGEAEIGLRTAAQGQVGRAVDALVGTATAVPDVGVLPPTPGSDEARDRDPAAPRGQPDDEGEGVGAGADEFVLSVDETKRGLEALQVRWLVYDEAYRAYRAALEMAQEEEGRGLLESTHDGDVEPTHDGDVELDDDEPHDDEQYETALNGGGGGGANEGVLALDERALDEPVQFEAAPAAAPPPRATWGNTEPVQSDTAPRATWGREPLGPAPPPPSSTGSWTRFAEPAAAANGGTEGQPELASWAEDDW